MLIFKKNFVGQWGIEPIGRLINVFKYFILFFNKYLSDINTSLITKIIDNYSLENYEYVYINEAGTLNSVTVAEVFRKALTNNTGIENIKMVSDEAQSILYRIFSPLITQKEYVYNTQITQAHLQQLLMGFDLEDKPEKEQAIYLYFLAMLFVRLSSVNALGENLESPNVLRVYALSLFNTAFIIDSNFMINVREGHLDAKKVSIDSIAKFRINVTDRLMGLNGELDCTATLYEIMDSFAKAQTDPLFSECYQQVIPVAWQ